jgi:hypothetical protein
MAQIIPLTNDGSRKVQVTTNAGILTFTTYYMPLIESWLCDIEDADGLALATGLNLVIAVDNLLKGRNVLNDYILRVISKDGVENNSPETLGDTCQLIMASVDEYVPLIYSEAA